MTATKTVQLDSLIESWAHSFGRVIELTTAGFTVLYSYTQKEISYSYADLEAGKIKMHD